jgi:hypothetical protein
MRPLRHLLGPPLARDHLPDDRRVHSQERLIDQAFKRSKQKPRQVRGFFMGMLVAFTPPYATAIPCS